MSSSLITADEFDPGQLAKDSAHFNSRPQVPEKNYPRDYPSRGKDFITVPKDDPDVRLVSNNHFQVGKTGKVPELYVYELTIGSQRRQNKNKSKAIFAPILPKADALKNNRQSFATDNMSTTIAWEKLHTSLIAFARNEVERCIKLVKVFIIPDRKDVKDADEQRRIDHLNKHHKRIKTAKSIGPRIGDWADDTLKFRKWIKGANDQLVQETKQTHVLEHMSDVFGKKHPFNDNLKAVNVGSDDDPVWYPREFLRILPYQMDTNLLPDRLVESMLKIACRNPQETRARIEYEGLKGLGVTRTAGHQAFVSFSDVQLSNVSNLKAGQV
jgi:hypothetical protein